jgi:hypothetical protein
MENKPAEMNTHSEDSFVSAKMKWAPCTIEDEDTGQLYWGSTNKPIVAIWEMHEALDYLKRIVVTTGHEAMKKLLEATGLKVELHDNEFIIIEEKSDE